jgi:hypothetical protein
MFTKATANLLAIVHHEKLRLFYAHIPVQFGVVDPTTPQPPTLR